MTLDLPASSLPAVRSRPYAGDDDFWRIRRLAVETFPVSGLGWNWDIRRWDGSRFYNADLDDSRLDNRTIQVWETVAGQLVGAAHNDGPGLFYLQIDPDFRHLEEEMIAWAEEHVSRPGGDGTGREILAEVWDYDAPRQRILAGRGYEQLPSGGVVRRMYFGQRPLPAVQLHPGYQLRPICSADLEDCQRLAGLLNAAFGRTFHNAAEFQNFARRAPSYNEDLHLVAVAPDGSFAAHVAAIYDAENRYGFFEPVCTHPEHRRKNLAQTLMFQLLHQVKALGAQQMTVETGDMIPANALYDSIGFTEAYKSRVWRRRY